MKVKKQTKHICLYCNTAFYSIRSDARYCSDDCAKKSRADKQKEYFNNTYYPENKNRIIKRVLENRKK